MGKVKIDKEALKKLREERKASIGRARGMIKVQNRNKYLVHV
jgi:predicted transcriptional regulator